MAYNAQNTTVRPAPASRRSWSYLRTPLRIYLIVMLPICALQVVLLVYQTPVWMKVSAALVIAFTLLGLARGYIRRLVVSPEGAALISLTRSLHIPWSRVARTGSYIPGGGKGATPYLYITAHDRPPAGTWEIDKDTLQIQDREGLLEIVEDARRVGSTAAGR